MTNNIFTQKKEVLDLIQNIMENSDTAEILEEKYKLYHKDFSSAMKHAYDTVKKMGYEVDPESINDKVAFGPRKPSSGKTNSYRLDLLKKGKPQKKGVQIQVYNMDNKSYELNMYLEEVELAEATGGLKMLGAADELEKYAKKYGGMDKKDFLKVAKLMRKGMSDKVVGMTNNLDTEPREKIVDVVANHIGVKSTEKMFGVKFLHRKESVENKEVSENKSLIKDYEKYMSQSGKKSHNAFDYLMSMPKYKRMSKDQMTKIIGDAKRKGIFKEEGELDENKKAALQKKLAKTAQSSKSGKDKVTLKKAPWDKKEELSPKQKKIDANNNGKVDGEDLAKLRSKKEEVLSQIKNLILDEGRKQVLAHGGKGQYKVVSTDGAVDVVFKGKVVGKGDYDRGADSFFISMKGQKGQKSFDDAQDIADYFAKNKIKEEVELQEYSALPTVETLKKMHDEGKTKKQIMAAYSGCDSVKLEKLYAQHCTEELEEKFSPKEIKMAIGVASDKRYAGGNMTGAVKAIDKIKKGLSNHPQVSAVLKRQNEDNVQESECDCCNEDPCNCPADCKCRKSEELSPKQKKIDKNKNGKIDGSDLANLRKKNEDFDVESLIESSDKKDAKEMADLVKELEPKIKMTELKKQVYDMAMEKYNNKTRAKKIASMIK
jgi:hypothetical protein